MTNSLLPATFSVWVSAALLGALLLSCAGPSSSAERPSAEEPGGPGSDLQFVGIVRYKDIEGGVWVIESSEGTTYNPENLPEEYREQGLEVRVWADRVRGQVGFQMVGPIISIRRIERL